MSQSYLDDFCDLEVTSIDSANIKEEEHQGASLCVDITNELELDFLISLCEEEPTERSISLVIPIEDYYKEIGKFNLTFDNVIKIRTYNPRLNLLFLINGKFVKLKDEDIINL